METTRKKRVYRRLILSAHSLKNRHNFILRCLEEKVIPKSLHKVFKTSTHIFPDYVQNYLESVAENLKHDTTQKFDKARLLRSELQSKKLFSSQDERILQRRIRTKDHKQRRNLERKLENLISTSEWKYIGRKDLINNLSKKELNNTEEEALSFGLKFAIGLPNYNMSDTIAKNYRYSDSDFDKGFVQGIITSSFCSSTNEFTIPLRYIQALKNLANNSNIHITTADKGGGVVILDKDEYISKIKNLLSDTDTYEKIHNRSSIDKRNVSFNKTLGKILKDAKPHWSRLIEYHPTLPKLYGLPKTHKPGTPIRPIISGIGSATHRIARAVAKILTPFLGKINNSHLKNSANLIDRIKNINMKNKMMASLDITSLYTNIPVKKCLHLLKDYLIKSKAKLDLPVDTIIKICDLITDQCFFQFNDTLYKQKFGLPMGSPISPVLACLYLEFLESGSFNKILPRTSTYLRYIDDVLIIYPRRTKIDELVNKLNNVEPSIKFTYELENNNNLPFLDTLLHRENDKIQRSVYRKPTYKNDIIHFYSHHTEKIKSGIIIGFYLRALRICSPEYLDNEMKYIEESFTTLRYPKHFIRSARRKAYKIFKNKDNIQVINDNKNQKFRRITLPTNRISKSLAKNLINFNIEICNQTSTTIKDITRNTPNKPPESNACIYSIPCTGCNSVYIGQTSRTLKQRLDEHRRALKSADPKNALVIHRNAKNHNFNIKKAHPIKFIKASPKRKLIESTLISQYKTIKQKTGSYHIAKPLLKFILNENKIPLDEKG